MAKQQSQKDTLSSILAQFNGTPTEERWPTGIRAMDILLGGGLTPGYCYGVYGVPGAGKTTIVMQMLRSLCKQSKRCIYIDVEKSFNSDQAAAFGLTEYLQSGQLSVVVMGTFSDIDKLVSAIAQDGSSVDCVVIDTITMARESVKADLSVEDVRPGLHARQTNFVLNKLKDAFYRHNIVSIVMFQSRANIDMNGGTSPYAPAYKQAGGYAEQHIPDVIIRVDIGAAIRDENKNQLGHIIKLSTDKNKFAPPKRVIARNFYFGRGIPKREEIIDDALTQGIITIGAAGYYTLPDGEKIHGIKALYNIPRETVQQLQSQLNGE